LPLFPQWSSIDRRDMLYRSYSSGQKRYKEHFGIEYPIQLDRMQILWSRYLVTKKWKRKSRYYRSGIDCDLEAQQFADQIGSNPYGGGRHCMYCTELTTCVGGVHVIDRR